jgi:AhpD family alkylhydroperoxidase
VPLVAPTSGPLARLIGIVARRQYGSPIDDSTAIMAGHVRLLGAFGAFNRAVERPGALGRELKDLASVRAATIVECDFCIDIGSEHARRAGLSDEQLLALPRARESGLFSEDQLLVIAFAEAVSRTPATLPPALGEAIRRRFDRRQIIELAYICAWENHRARMNIGLGIEPGGFSEGRVCASPQSAVEAGTPAGAPA